MKRILGLAISMALAGSAGAQTFECGASACGPLNGQTVYDANITGIDNLVVEGKTYDVTFGGTTASSIKSARKARDAAAAIESLFASLPIVGADEVAPYDRTFQIGQIPTKVAGLYDTFLFQPNDGSYSVGLLELTNRPATCFAACATFTLVKAAKAPELDSGSLVGALTLVFGGIAVVTGSRHTQQAAPV